MPWDGGGNYSLPVGSTAVTGTTILASTHNNPVQDIANSLNAVFLRSGIAPMTGNLNLNSNRIVQVANGVNNTDAVNLGQVLVRDSGAAAQTVTSTSDTPLIIRQTDDGAGSGPVLWLERISASPAANDAIGGVVFRGRNSGGNMSSYAGIVGQMENPTAGAEEGVLYLNVASGSGVASPRLAVSGTAISPMNNGTYNLGAGTFRYANVFTNAVELGNPSDTTLTRSAAGVVAVEGTPLLRANQNLEDVSNRVTSFGTLANALPGLPTASPNSGDLVPMYAAGSTGVWRADSSTNVLERMFRGKFGTTKGMIAWYSGTNWVGLSPPGGSSTYFLALDSAKNIVWALPPP